MSAEREQVTIVYVAPVGTWLPFVDEDGVNDALELSKPMRLVAERDYAKLAAALIEARAERDTARWERDMAQSEYQKVYAQLASARERLDAWVAWGDRMASGHPDAPMASLDHEVRAVIENRHGMLRAAITAALSEAP